MGLNPDCQITDMVKTLPVFYLSLSERPREYSLRYNFVKAAFSFVKLNKGVFLDIIFVLIIVARRGKPNNYYDFVYFIEILRARVI